MALKSDCDRCAPKIILPAINSPRHEPTFVFRTKARHYVAHLAWDQIKRDLK